jgi:hypothetical protein
MSEKLFKRLDITAGWAAFLIAAIVYMLTLEPTVSFWDCGEFTSTANKLEVGHPPGAPFFMISARIFAMFAHDKSQIALMVNSLSAIASAFTIMFLYWSIAYFAKRMIAADKQYTAGKTIAIIGSSLVGALVYTFSDTFWFSAAEAEVYAYSSFFTAIAFWAILKWSDAGDEKIAARWILLIALLTGMAIGVHLLNLLTIPAIAFVVYFKKFKPNLKGLIITAIISLFIIASLMWGLIPGVGIVASQLELMFVNTFGAGYNTGLIVWVILTLTSLIASIYVTQYSNQKWLKIILPIIAIILTGIPFISSSTFFNIIILGAIALGTWYIVNKKKDTLLNLIITSITLIMVGYSTYAVIIIRSNANPPMDQNSPDDVFNFLSYLNREQYGDRPLAYGPYYNVMPKGLENTDAIYVARNGKYEKAGYRNKYIYDSKDCTIFPRMYNFKDNKHIEIYKDYGKVKRNAKPEFSNNLKFFFDYQLGWMYWRYFMWNFAGRQNDIQGNGSNMYGNWLSGIKFIDNAILGDQDKLPDYLKNNKANNKYYMLPLLLGLLGLGFQFIKHRKDCLVVSLLFILTGIAIVVYLNQTPNQPRERDYAYAGSFYAFSIWVGLGLLAIYKLLSKFSPTTLAAGVATLICLPVPYIMAKENWNDHDRSNRYIARDVGHNYLISCAPNSILFTYADNDTFPVWYAQEVEEIRTDVKVCCLSYFVSDWYIDQMKMQTYTANPMPLTITRDKYEPSIRETLSHKPTFYRQPEPNNYISVNELLDKITDDRERENGIYFYPQSKYYIDCDKQVLLNNNIITPEDIDKADERMLLNLNRRELYRSDMMLMDMFRTNNWKRPIFYTSLNGINSIGMQDYFHNQGAIYQVLPIKTNAYADIDVDKMYDNYMNKYRWGNMEDTTIYIDHTITNITKSLGIRNNFGKLAKKLEERGDREKAREVMEKGETVMPISSFPPGRSDLLFAAGWYSIEEYEKGDNYIKEAIKINNQSLQYLFNVKDKQALNRNKDEIAMTLYTYIEIIKYAYSAEREELYNETLTIFGEYKNLFKSIYNQDFEEYLQKAYGG